LSIPTACNPASNCTRELKQRPIDAYLRENYKGFEIVRVIGIRADEAHRKSNNADKENLIYPLCDELKVNSKFIRNWWSQQSFDSLVQFEAILFGIGYLVNICSNSSPFLEAVLKSTIL